MFFHRLFLCGFFYAFYASPGRFFCSGCDSLIKAYRCSKHFSHCFEWTFAALHQWNESIRIEMKLLIVSIEWISSENNTRQNERKKINEWMSQTKLNELQHRTVNVLVFSCNARAFMSQNANRNEKKWNTKFAATAKYFFVDLHSSNNKWKLPLSTKKLVTLCAFSSFDFNEFLLLSAKRQISKSNEIQQKHIELFEKPFSMWIANARRNIKPILASKSAASIVIE